MESSIGKYFLVGDKVESSTKFQEKLFMNGYSIYEVIRISLGVPMFVKDHIERLKKSAKLTGGELDCSEQSIIDSVLSLIRINELNDGKVKLIAHPSKGNLVKPNDIIYFIPEYYFPTMEEYDSGVILDICHTSRLNPNAKVLNTPARNMCDSLLAKESIFEILMEDDDGFLTEGSRSNLFYVMGENIFTPPTRDVLPGVTRKNIIKSCKENGISVVERRLAFDEIPNVDALFISGTSLKVLPVKQVKGSKFEVKNTLLQTVMNIYNRYFENHIKHSQFQSS